MGFTNANATRQKDWEKQFDAQLDAKNLDTWMKYLSSHPANPHDEVIKTLNSDMNGEDLKDRKLTLA